MAMRQRPDLEPAGSWSARRRALRAALVLAAALFASGCDASGSMHPTPTNQGPVVATDFEGRSVPFMTKTDPLKLVVVGDSVALPGFGCGAGCPGFEDRYAEHLERVTARPVIVTNLSIDAGYHLDRILAMLGSEPNADAVAEADVVVVAVGSEMHPPWTPTDPCRVPWEDEQRDVMKQVLGLTDACVSTTLETQSAELDRLYAQLQRLRGAGPQVGVSLGVFNSIADVGPGWGSETGPAWREATAVLAGILERWNAASCVVATRHGFTCVDVFHAFRGDSGGDLERSYLGTNGWHQSAEGGAVIADLLAKVDVSAVR
jgi:hypothetical protein